MPVPLLIVIFIALILIVSIVLIVRVYVSRERNNAKLYAERIRDLEKALAGANAEIEKRAQSLLNEKSGRTTEYYAGLSVKRLNHGVVLIDRDRIVRLINTYAERYLDAKATAEKPMTEVIHLEKADGTKYEDIFDTAFLGEDVILPEGVQLTCQRGTYPVSGSLLPIKTDGQVTAFVFEFADISGEVERLREEQTFFSAAAHELRTPLTVIRMTVALLKDKFDTLGHDKVMEYLRRADETAAQLSKLVNDFLNISRIEQGRLVLTPERFDIITLTDEVIADLKLLAKERNLYINHEPVESESRTVMGDKTKSKEVLVNLVSNGLKYTVQGGLTISHRLTNGLLATDISDTGAGIPPESQSLLFKRFGQVGGARKLSSTKSSGLGLYISKKLAILMHGDVILTKSEPGKGSTFTFLLPPG